MNQLMVQLIQVADGVQTLTLTLTLNNPDLFLILTLTLTLIVQVERPGPNCLLHNNN